ncbi:restriction endonuclease subunit S [Streptococcus suis]
MPNKERNIPKRRFKEFENADAWELRKLGELGTLKNGMNFSKDAMGTGFPFINLQNIFGKNVVDISQLGLAMASSIQLKNYNLQKGDVLFVRSSVKLEGVGEAAIVPKDLEDTTYSGFIIRYRDSFGLDNNFKRYTFGTNNIRNQIMSQATDSANKNISQQVLAELDILVPSLPEQEAIGTFFSTLDRQITLHQRKLDKLKSVKQAYLSEMFPAEGERVPKRRFPGFTDDWELRKLGEVAEIIGGGTPSTSNSEFWDGDIDWYTPAEIGEQIYVDGSERKITQLGLDKSSATLLPANKTILFTSRAGIGKTAILRSDATTNQGFQSIVVDNNTEPYFIFSMTDKIKNKAISVASGSTFAEISSRALGQLEFMFPSINEQSAIGTFFSTLDQQITLHQRKLEKLKNLKKALLNELFV